MKSLQIVGRKKSGKTGLTECLIPLLQKRGLRVGTVKHTSNPYPLDRPGSDSQRHRAAGAGATLIITASGAALHLPLPQDSAGVSGLIEKHLDQFDLVLIEGWARRRGPKIEVVPPGNDGQPLSPQHLDSGDLLGVVLGPGLTGTPERCEGIACFAWDQTEAVADLVLQWFRGSHQSHRA